MLAGGLSPILVKAVVEADGLEFAPGSGAAASVASIHPTLDILSAPDYPLSPAHFT